jgi:hypothetical protein
MEKVWGKGIRSMMASSAILMERLVFTGRRRFVCGICCVMGGNRIIHWRRHGTIIQTAASDTRRSQLLIERS